jgi:Calcium/calmodulin dependent protein kinase II Association.
MKRTIILMLITVATISSAFGQQSKAKAAEEERTRQELMQLERDIGKANIDSDYAFFDRVEAEEFIFTDAGGGLTNKKQDLEGLKQTPNPDVKLTAYDVDDMNVRLYDKTAVVTGRVTTKRLVKGQAMTSQSRFTDVFVWRDGRWQLVAGHSSRIRTP